MEKDKRPVKGAVSVKSKDKLKAFVKESIKDFWTEVLNLAEVSVDGKDRYMALRSKVLTKGNDAVRSINRELDLYYLVEYVANKESLVVINKKEDNNKDEG